MSFGDKVKQLSEQFKDIDKKNVEKNIYENE